MHKENKCSGVSSEVLQNEQREEEVLGEEQIPNLLFKILFILEYYLKFRIGRSLYVSRK